MAKTKAAGGEAPPGTPGKPKRIADELRGLIISGDLDEGDLLGTESELLDRFDVSRPSLRESLRILEAEGLVSVARGSLGGVIVHRPDQRNTARAAALVLQSRSVSLTDVFEASAVIEPAATRMVALSRGHKRAAEHLHAIVVDMKRHVEDPVLCITAMVRFHSDIVQLAGNQTLILICEMINEVIVRAVADVLTRSQSEPIASRRRTIRSFEQLVQLIAEGDGDGAQAHCAAHMARVRRTMLGDNASSIVDLNHHR